MTINRRLFLGMLTVFSVAAGAFASTPEEIATEFFRNSSPENLRHAKSLRLESIDTESDMFKVFNRAGGGFVVLENLDGEWEIAAYGSEGEFRLDEENSGLIQDLFSNMDGKSVQAVKAAGTPVKGPYLTTKWNQDAPYNRFCPYDVAIGKRMPAGCTTVALAQLLFYHKTPSQSTFHKFDWDKMRDSYEDGEYTEEEADAVATLFADLCQEATRVTYTANSTGGKAPLRYDGFSRIYVYPKDWIDFLNQTEEPQILSVRGRNTSSLHCVILDGIDSNGFWHINWGWGGLNDGWYRPNTLTSNTNLYELYGDSETQRFLNRDPQCYEPKMSLEGGVEISTLSARPGEMVSVVLKDMKYNYTEFFNFSYANIWGSFSLQLYYPFPWETDNWVSPHDDYERGYVGKICVPDNWSTSGQTSTKASSTNMSGANVSLSFTMPDIPENQERVLRPEYYLSYQHGQINFREWPEGVFEMAPDSDWRPFMCVYSGTDETKQIPNCFILKKNKEGLIDITPTSVGELMNKAKEVSGIEEITVDGAENGLGSSTQAEIYTISGIRLAARSTDGLPAGLYIVRQEDKTQKVFIR